MPPKKQYYNQTVVRNQVLQQVENVKMITFYLDV